MKTVLLNLRKIYVMSAVMFVFVLLWTSQTVLAQETPPAPPSFSCASVTEIPTVECEALVALYNSTDGDNWQWDFGGSGSWLQTSFPCSWEGVFCLDGSVIELDKRGKNLSGELPPEIGNLTNLTTLSLGYRFNFMLMTNSLTKIPSEIGNLTNLKTLELDGNQLTSLPAEIGDLVNLTELSLNGNELMSVPAEIGNLINLEILDLSGNPWTSFPTEFGNLTNLRTLDLSVSLLTTVPAEIGNLTNLTTLNLRGNQFTTFPAEIGTLTNLTDLNLSDNPLTIVSAEIGDLTSLTDLNLSRNQLAMLPAEIGNLANLVNLDLSDNQLTMLPAEIGNLTSLVDLGLSDNQLITLPSEILDLTNLGKEDDRGLTPFIAWVLDDSMCVDAETTDIEAWSDITGLNAPTSCSFTTISFSFHLDSPLNSSFESEYTYGYNSIPIGIPIEPSLLPNEYTLIVTGTNSVTQSVVATIDDDTFHVGTYSSWVSRFGSTYSRYTINSTSSFDSDWERLMGVTEESFGGENFLMMEVLPDTYTFDLIETELLGRWEFGNTIHCVKQHRGQPDEISFEIDKGTEFVLEAGDQLHCGYTVREQLPDGVGTVQFAFESYTGFGADEIAITGYDKISNAIIFSDTVPIDSFFTYYTDPAALPVGNYDFRPVLREGVAIDRTRCYTGREQIHAEIVWESNLAIEILDNQLVSCDFWLRPAIIDPSTLPFSQDFGDLPDVYSTIGENAPSHELVPDETQIMLGSSVTTEPNGKPAIWAWGDDEDNGVRHLGDRLIGNYPRNFSVSVLGGVPSEGASLAVWIDWDYNNQFDEDEFSAFNVTIGENTIEIPPTDDYHDIPNDDRTKRFLVTRFRLFSPEDIPGGTLDWTDYEGAAVNGEIEDYVFFYNRHNLPEPEEIPVPVGAKDFGDLPDSYSTTGENAPSHELVPEEEQIMLGNTITFESDGQPDVFASHDSDDGSRSPASFVAGIETTIYIDVADNIPPDGAPLGIWMDWDNNGQFSEEEFFSMNVHNGYQVISVTPPDDYEAYSLAIRFRLFSPDHIPGGTLDWTDYEGAAVNGEIEDYFFASNHPLRNRTDSDTDSDDSSIGELVDIAIVPDVAEPDIEFTKCVPITVNSSNRAIDISARSCPSETQNAPPLSVSFHSMRVTHSISLVTLLSFGALLLGSCVLRYGRN